MNKEELIAKLKALIVANNIKQKEYQEKYNLSSEVSCLTREACQMFSLYPKMLELSVTFKDCE